jgi:hypothetical protein
VRRLVHGERTRLSKRAGNEDVAGPPRPIHWLDRSSWWGVASKESLRVALALEVPDSHLQVTLRRHGRGKPRVGLTWTGTIHYPPDLAIRLGTQDGPQVWLSEATLCGAQVDGALTPFRLSLTSEFDADDPRLRPQGPPEHNRIEALFHRIAHFWPTFRRALGRNRG